jgi:hypothetical protein
MQPKFNKLIMLLLLLGTFAFFMKAEQRIMSYARTNLSDWASLLPSDQQADKASINPYAQETSLIKVHLLKNLFHSETKNN